MSCLKHLVDFTSHIPTQTTPSREPSSLQNLRAFNIEQCLRKSSELALGNPVSIRKDKKPYRTRDFVQRCGKKRKRTESDKYARPDEVSNFSSDVDISLSDGSMASEMREMSSMPPNNNGLPSHMGSKPTVVKGEKRERASWCKEREKKMETKIAFLSREFKRISARFAYLPSAASNLRKKLDDIKDVHNKVVKDVLSQTTPKTCLRLASGRVGLIPENPYPKPVQPGLDIPRVDEGQSVFPLTTWPYPVFPGHSYGDNHAVLPPCVFPRMKDQSTLQSLSAKPYQQQVYIGQGRGQVYAGGQLEMHPHIKGFSHDFDLPPMIGHFSP